MDLKAILKSHKEWLESGGEDGQQANLQHAHLWKADLRDSYLQYAFLQDADLWRADLRQADLQHANLRGVKIFSGWTLVKEDV